MKLNRIDALVLKEIAGPWVFGVTIFTTLIMAGTYLFKITNFIVQGIDPALLLQLTAVLMPGIIVKTFSMASLLAALLAFGRLSSDSEIVALKAAGASMGRIMRPVLFFCLGVGLLAFIVNETIVPGAATKATTIQIEIAKKLDSSSWKPVFSPINDPRTGQVAAMVVALDFNFQKRTLKGAWVLSYDKSGDPGYMLYAPQLQYQDEQNWRIVGGSKLFSYSGQEIGEFNGDIWPSVMPTMAFKPEDILAGNLKDLDSFSMRKTLETIQEARKHPLAVSKAQVANLEYGYFNKMALPLAAIIFGLVGAPLGIRNHRTGAASGFFLSILIIFGYMTLANLMAVYAQGGSIPSWAASFAPLLLGVVFAAILIRRRNV